MDRIATSKVKHFQSTHALVLGSDAVMIQHAGGFASKETQDNFLVQCDHYLSELTDEDSAGFVAIEASDPRSVAFAVLAELELDKLEKLPQTEGRWRGQTIFNILESKIYAMLPDIHIVVNAAAECFAREDTTLRIQQPCFVFGDIHGTHCAPNSITSALITFSLQETSTISSDSRAFYGRWA